jgi:hypothetical protein
MSEPVWVNFPVSATNVAQFNGAVRCDAFYSNDDQDRHVLVATSSDLWEVFYSYRGIATAELQSLQLAPQDIAGFYSPNDKSRHALTADPRGLITEITFHPVVPALENEYGTVLRMSAFYNTDTHFCHAMLLQPNSFVYDLSWNINKIGPVPFSPFLLGHFAVTLVAGDVAGFYTPDDKTKHAILAGADGTLAELYWSTDFDEKGATGEDITYQVPDLGKTILGKVPGGIDAVAAFYVEGAQYTRRVVAAGPQGVFEFAYDPSIASVRAAKLLVPSSEVLDIGGFYSPDDNVCHAILLLKGDGRTQIVQEVYYPA